jgi:hypothetical protein
MDQASTSWGWGLPEQEIGHDPDHRERPDHDHPGNASSSCSLEVFSSNPVRETVRESSESSESFCFDLG